MFKLFKQFCNHSWKAWAAYNATIFLEDEGIIKENTNVVVFKCKNCGKYMYDYNHK